MRITFLIYCARSGSTFLANRIAENRSNVVVIPEFRLPLLLFWRSEDEIRGLDADGLTALFRRDMQMDNLGLDETRLAALATALAGQGRREILLAFLDAYRETHGLSGQHFLVKNAEVVFEEEAVRAVVPEADFLEILRDPRGVVNSMMNTRTVYSYGGPMAGGDPLRAAAAWLKHRRASAALSMPLTVIRYEDLMSDPESMDATLDALFGPAGETATATPSGKVVSAKEQSLHKLVGKAADKGRNEAWKDAIPARTGMALEAVLGATMTEAGYVPHFTAGATEADIGAALSRQRLVGRAIRVRHLARTGMHWAREAMHAPGEVLFRIENARRARR
ncbi:sulfotransferase [Chachezhania sediminis]|uniref:sulfotransferase n=1 Tax=Chachezhania sediminis TaxID=2599291 RepID=UPI00131B3A56|nr:sulfotransferase [Chachezhania sediminis]